MRDESQAPVPGHQWWRDAQNPAGQAEAAGGRLCPCRSGRGNRNAVGRLRASQQRQLGSRDLDDQVFGPCVRHLGSIKQLCQPAILRCFRRQFTRQSESDCGHDRFIGSDLVHAGLVAQLTGLANIIDVANEPACNRAGDDLGNPLLTLGEYG